MDVYKKVFHYSHNAAVLSGMYSTPTDIGSNKRRSSADDRHNNDGYTHTDEHSSACNHSYTAGCTH
jgi:hypothetical protein